MSLFSDKHIAKQLKEYPDQKVRIIEKLFATDLLLDSKEDKQSVARNLNIVALVISFSHACYLLFSGIMTLTFLGIATCYFPAVLCFITELFFRNGKLNVGMLFTFTTVPIAITIKGLYEPMAGLMLFPFTYGIVSFFLLPKPKIVYPVFALSVICFTTIDVAYHYKYNHNFKSDISLIVFNDLLFSFLVYTVLGYLRNQLIRYQTQNKIKESELSVQNQQLQTQQEEIASQNDLLQQRNHLLIDSWQLQQRITSVLSHDIRTSLIFLRHVISASKKAKKNDKESLDFITELDEEIKNMNTVFDGVLQWLKQPAMLNNFQKEIVNVFELADEIRSSFLVQAKTKGIIILNKIDADQKVYANTDYLKVVFRNLIGNAIKFTKRGGHILMSGNEKGSKYNLYFEDTGVGISAVNLHKINEGIGFSTNGTHRETGIGLGLVFCRDFISKCGGSMEVNSTLGKGTTFTIVLPLNNIEQHGEIAGENIIKEESI